MRLTLFLVLMMLLAVPSMNGQPQGIGASGDEGCYCHGGAADETVILVHGLPDRFNVSQTYEFSVEVHHPTIEPASGGAAIGGFRITVDNGALPVPANASLAHVVDDGLTHTRAGAMERNWTFNWTAPDDPEARVAFSFVANAVNGNAVGNGNGNSGDAWNRIELRSVGPAWWDPGYAYTPPPEHLRRNRGDLEPHCSRNHICSIPAVGADLGGDTDGIDGRPGPGDVRAWAGCR